ncbi:MAG TPA: hypothetical protein PKV72_02545 [Candidatus Peribacteria bacterium]|nr:hypothetical protein [Candidatus Peribacteria bacterium]
MNHSAPASPVRHNWLLEQVVPLLLTVASFCALWLLLHGEVVLLNRFSPGEPMLTKILWSDVLIGLTIYLKTSIDFAIFIGHLMRTHPGWKNRIAIETGTAAGNALGTFIILILWNYFREIQWLLALMVLIASLVLLKLAEDGLEHAQGEDAEKYPGAFKTAVVWCKAVLSRVNAVFAPVLGRLIPHATLNVTKSYGLGGLLVFAASIPFILGLDDFAGYVPLFSVVHVYGFAVGVLLGHMLLNLCLFLSPETTIRLVKQPVISFLGSLAFVGLAVWGLTEVWHILHAG